MSEHASTHVDGFGDRPAYRRRWLLLGAAFLGLYAFATLVPRGSNWGLHALGYFPLPIRWLGLALCAAFLCPPVQERCVTALRVLRPLFERSLRAHGMLLAVGVSSFLLFYSIPINTTVYGDSRTILHWWADNSELPPSEWLARIFDARLLSSKEVLSLLLHRTVAHLLELPIGQVYHVLSALSGALCLCLWLQFLRREFAGSRWAPLLLLMGCFLGSHQIFFGHVESYPFVFLVSMAFLVMGSLSLQRGASFATVLVLFVLAFKSHSVSVYFLPAFLFLVVHRLSQRFPSIGHLLAWRAVTRWLVVPSIVIAAALYFFYFRSYNEPHTGVGRAFEQTFLPLVSPPPPMQYSFLSLDHLADLGNVLLLVGTPVMVALLGLLLFHRRSIAWSEPRVVFASLALLYPILFMLAVNPALSMPRDWDLYSLLGAPLLLFFATALAHSGDRVPAAPVHGTALGFVAFAMGFFALNASTAPLSRRLEDVGEHVFRTYHANAAYLIHSAQAMEPDPQRALERRRATALELAPWAVGEDLEYVHLLMGIASMHRERNDREEALSWVERAAGIAPRDVNVSLWLADYSLWAGHPGKAQRAVDAVLQRDPGNVHALVQGAAVAAQQSDFARALDYLERAAVAAPGDQDIAAWSEQIRKRHNKTKGGA